jgi:hypothetical protein
VRNLHRPVVWLWVAAVALLLTWLTLLFLGAP